MTELTYKTVEIPQTVVTRKPNPFAALIEDLQKNGGARAFEMPNKTADDGKAIESAIGHIQRGARAVGMSARKKVTDAGSGKATVTVWLVEKITRERKDS